LDSIAHVALLLALLLIAAKLGGEAAARLKQPPVLGELVAGIVLGNAPISALHALGDDRYVGMLAQLGVLILLFEVGLESTVAEVLHVGMSAVRIAALGTIGSFAAGFLAARVLLPAAPAAAHVFLALTICATSVGITARVFKDLGKARSAEARTILSAAVIDDIIGLVILALAVGWIRSSGAMTAGSLAWLLTKTLGFLAISIALGVKITPRLFAIASRLRTPGVLLCVGLSFCFLFAWASDAMGLAPIVGAYSAGLVLEDLHSARFVARGEKSLTELIEPISELLVPIFFVVMGIHADVRAFLHPSTLGLAAALTIAAFVGKLACGLGAARNTNRLTIAFGMMPRGEVTLIFAGLGMTLTIANTPVLDRSAYSAIVIAVVLTTVLTPPLLKWSFSRAANAT